jgi:hypothetical protein
MAPSFRAIAYGLTALAVLGSTPLACAQRATAEDAVIQSGSLAITSLPPGGATVSSVVATISGPALSTPVQTTLVLSHYEFAGIIGNLPAGSSYTVHVDAFAEDGGAPTFSGEQTNVTVLADRTASVLITLQQTTPSTPFSNSAPRIKGVTVSNGNPSPNEVVQLVATAEDLDDTNLSFSWSGPGTFSDTKSAAPSWTAPAVAGNYALKLAVDDGRGGHSDIFINIIVGDSKGSLAVTAFFNSWPVVDGITAETGTFRPGTSARVIATAHDSDHDNLQYAWSTTCDGTFSNPSDSSPLFTLRAASSSTYCKLSVAVTDGNGGSTSGTYQIATTSGPPPVAYAPIVDSTFMSRNYAVTQEEVVLRVAAHSADGSAVSTKWTATKGEFYRETVSAGLSEIRWSVSTCSDDPITVTATTSNASGAEVQTSFLIYTQGCPPPPPKYALALSPGGNGVALPASMDFSGDSTVEMWVYLRSYQSVSLGFNKASSGREDRVLQFVNGIPSTYYYLADGRYVRIQGDKAISLNAWHHVATQVAGTIALFVDGQLIGAMPYSSALGTSSANAWIGGAPPDRPIAPDGFIADVRVSRSLRYATSFGSPGPLSTDVLTVGFWPLNESSGTSANDVSSNGNTGTLVGSATWSTDAGRPPSNY